MNQHLFVVKVYHHLNHGQLELAFCRVNGPKRKQFNM